MKIIIFYINVQNKVGSCFFGRKNLYFTRHAIILLYIAVYFYKLKGEL